MKINSHRERETEKDRQRNKDSIDRNDWDFQKIKEGKGGGGEDGTRQTERWR